MLRSILDTTHPDHDRELLADYEALYAGGKKFRSRIARFLPQNENEPPALYELRKKAAKYRSYLGPIVDFFAAFLLSSPFEPSATEENGTEKVKVDAWYSKFKEDCDGLGTDLDEFIRSRVSSALVGRRSWMRLEKETAAEEQKPAETLAEFQARNQGDLKLVPIDSSIVLDWATDDEGELVFLITYEQLSTRTSWAEGRGVTRHEWRVYTDTTVEVYAFNQKGGEKLPDEIPRESNYPHGFARVPILCLDVGENFWVANRIADAQKEHFEMGAALGWSIRRTCYAMPVLKLAPNADGSRSSPTFGTGYWLELGDKDDIAWFAPPGEVYTVIQSEIANQKDEIYRLSHQMALGVNNNAATVGRSGESKLADAEAVKVILTSLGEMVRGFVESLYQMVSGSRGETYNWSVDGLNSYSDVDIGAVIEATTAALAMNIPSATFLREIRTRVALSLAGNCDQPTKDKIRKEIADGTTDEEAGNTSTIALGGRGLQPAPDEKQPGNGKPKPSFGAAPQPGPKG